MGSPIIVSIVTVVVAYDCKSTGTTYIMVVNNDLYLKYMEVNLIAPMMMRLAGIEVDECLKFLSCNPAKENHSTYFCDDDLRVPIMLEGIISYFTTRIPTEKNWLTMKVHTS